MLLELAVDEGRRNGCGRVWLYTNAVMTENVGYYERRGFVQYDRRIDQGYDRIYFERACLLSVRQRIDANPRRLRPPRADPRRAC